MGLKISQSVRNKLQHKTPPVSEDEILQCFASRPGRYLVDTREENRTDPPTRWFIAETDRGRSLKVVFIRKGTDVTIKTAYDPNPEEIRIYRKYS
jgi:hypothetical protein